MRSVVLSVKENEYVTASEALGASRLRILVKEIIPNSISSVLIMATTDIGNQILMFSTLSFLGLGSAPPTPEWGMMVSEGVDYFNKFWVAGFPGLAIFTMAVGANFIGDGLRDLLDPKLRKDSSKRRCLCYDNRTEWTACWRLLKEMGLVPDADCGPHVHLLSDGSVSGAL